jgi:hypothetical protein
MTMAILRLSNGGDVSVKLSVEDTIAAITIVTGGGPDFVELPGEEGPIHIRPAGVLAIIDNAEKRQTGFRVG